MLIHSIGIVHAWRKQTKKGQSHPKCRTPMSHSQVPALQDPTEGTCWKMGHLTKDHFRWLDLNNCNANRRAFSCLVASQHMRRVWRFWWPHGRNWPNQAALNLKLLGSQKPQNSWVLWFKNSWVDGSKIAGWAWSVMQPWSVIQPPHANEKEKGRSMDVLNTPETTLMRLQAALSGVSEPGSLGQEIPGH